MKENYLHIVYGDEKEEFIKDLQSEYPGHYTTCLMLGAPDPEEFYRRCFEFLQVKDQYKYINNINLILPDDKMAIFKPILQRVMDDVSRCFGSYPDSLVGIENMFTNIDYLIDKPDVSDIQIETDAAILVMAGASVELEFERLKELQKDYLIITCDALIVRCFEEGLIPDIVVSSERVALTSEFFRDLTPEMVANTLFLGNVVCYPDTFKLYPGPIATFYRASQESEWLRRRDKNKEALIWAPPTVSSVSLGICGYLGINKVILVGQDLCNHPETLQSHADLRMETFKSWSEPKTEAEVKKMDLCRKAKANDPKYGEVWTNSRWFAFGTELYRIAKVYNIDLINTSKLGLQIPGIKYMPLEDAVKEMPSKGKTLDYPLENPHKKKDYKRIRTKIGRGLKECTSIKIGSLGPNGIDYFRKFFSFGYLGLTLMLRPFVDYEHQKFRAPWKEPSLRPAFETWLYKTKTDLIRVLSTAYKYLKSSGPR